MLWRLLLFLGSATWLHAHWFVPPETVDWEAVRKAQPEGVTLTLKLQKATFYQGEIIPATLVFTNTSATPYYVTTHSNDRSGRLKDTSFYAFDETGTQLADPLAWLQRMFWVGGGMRSEQVLGEWALTLTANQWLRFDQPGRYTLRVWNARVNPKSYATQREADIPLVSDPVAITITPLAAEEERQIIQTAMAQLEQGGTEAEVATETLRYLGTEASRGVLLARLPPEGYSFADSAPFYSVADPEREAARILSAVRSGKVPYTTALARLYQMLRVAPLYQMPRPEGDAAQAAFGARLYAKEGGALKEINAAGLEASGGKGPVYREVLLTRLFAAGYDGKLARASLVGVQLKLSWQQAQRIITYWETHGSEAFLPLLRKFANAPYNEPKALQLLAALRPEEARPLIIADFPRSDRHYSKPNIGDYQLHAAFLALPKAPIPKLEPYFREQLAGNLSKDAPFIASAIARYGTPALLPEVVRVYEEQAAKWPQDTAAGLFRYWLRQDPAPALEAFSQYMEEHPSFNRGNLLKEVLLEEWHPWAIPLVVKALKSPDPYDVVAATAVLEAHFTAADGLEPATLALEQLAQRATLEDPQPLYLAQSAAHQLLQSPRWKGGTPAHQRLKTITELKTAP